MTPPYAIRDGEGEIIGFSDTRTVETFVSGNEFYSKSEAAAIQKAIDTRKKPRSYLEQLQAENERLTLRREETIMDNSRKPSRLPNIVKKALVTGAIMVASIFPNDEYPHRRRR